MVVVVVVVVVLLLGGLVCGVLVVSVVFVRGNDGECCGREDGAGFEIMVELGVGGVYA